MSLLSSLLWIQKSARQNPMSWMDLVMLCAQLLLSPSVDQVLSWVQRWSPASFTQKPCLALAHLFSLPPPLRVTRRWHHNLCEVITILPPNNELLAESAEGADERMREKESKWEGRRWVEGQDQEERERRARQGGVGGSHASLNNSQ